jgi:hypothetical protein
MTNNKELTSTHFDNQKMENINNKQQTSVEWLHDELFKSFEKFYTLQFTMEEYQANNVKLYLQAQAMHKKEIVDAYYVDNEKNEGFEYYHAIYGGGEQ